MTTGQTALLVVVLLSTPLLVVSATPRGLLMLVLNVGIPLWLGFIL